MTKKTLNYAFFILLLSSLTITNWSCDKIFGKEDEEEPEGIITAEKTSLKSGEVCMLSADFELTSDSYPANFNNEYIYLIANNNSLFFVVPNIEAGTYSLVATVNEIDYNFSFDIIQSQNIENPDQYVGNIKQEVIALIENNILFTSELVAVGLMDSIEAVNNTSLWYTYISEINQQFESLSESDKLEFAQMYEANRDWIDEFMALTSSSYYKSGWDCKPIFDAGRLEHEEGNTFTAAKYALEYKFCKLEKVQTITSYVNKVTTLLSKIDPLSYMATVWEMVVTPIIDRISKELGINKDEVIGDDFEDDNKVNLTFINNTPKNIFATIRYRSVNQSDVNAGNSFSSFAGIYNQFISSFQSFLNIYPDNNAFAPFFSNNSKSIPFNHYMEILNISNSLVVLKSSSIVDDNWEVVFETDKTEDQTFTYDLIYNDGKTELSKTISATLTINICPPTVIDADGNVYNTVQIGTQCWMKENLKTTSYKNGISIPYESDGNNWSNLSTGAYVWNKNDNSWKDIYGALYNWYAVDNVNGLCPEGWHVPGWEEWKALTVYIEGVPSDDGQSPIADLLKSCRQVDSPMGGNCNTADHPRWTDSNIYYGTDNYGFSALPGGFRWTDGGFSWPGYNTKWWSSENFDKGYMARMAEIDHRYNLIWFGSGEDKKYGLSVRCLKD